MKRLLLICYSYPPRQSIGAVRPAALAKYLPEFGWEPVVLTPKLPSGRRPEGEVIETGYQDVLGSWKSKFGLDPKQGLHEQLKLSQSSAAASDLRHSKAVYWLKSWLAYPDRTKGWLPFARNAIREFAQREQVDAILSTAPPITSHLLGMDARKLLGRPWVADCRDLWVPARHGSRLARRMMGSLERRTLDNADALVTVSSPWAELLRKQYPSKPVTGITNGFDPDDFPGTGGDLTSTFSITYTGNLYLGWRDPNLLFETLAELLREGALPKSQMRLRFFCPRDPWLTAAIKRYGLEEVAEVHGWVSRDTALQHQRESQMLLLLSLNVPVYSGGIPGKLFEYLAARRPILAFGGERGVVDQILTETGAGIFTTSKDQMRDFLIKSYQEFRAQGKVDYPASQAAIDRYSHREMARTFSQVLDETVEKASPHLRTRQAEPEIQTTAYAQ
jgi:Glycosyltransferase Family 4